MSEPDDLIVVYVSQGPLQAEVARAKLESNNIPAVLRYSPVGRAFGITVDGLGRVEVLVHPRDMTAARALLGEMAPDEADQVGADQVGADDVEGAAPPSAHE